MKLLIGVFSFWLFLFQQEGTVDRAHEDVMAVPADCREAIAWELQRLGFIDFYTVERIGEVEEIIESGRFEPQQDERINAAVAAASQSPLC